MMSLMLWTILLVDPEVKGGGLKHFPVKVERKLLSQRIWVFASLP
jgi:hypothetical protein